MKFHIKLRLAAILTVAVLQIGGCASTKSTSTKEYIPSGSTIGVVAVFNDEAQLITVGTTVFNNEFDHKDVAEWQISKAIQQITEKKAGKRGFLYSSTH